MKLANKLILFFLFFLPINISLAKVKVISSKVPIELKTLIETISLSSLDDEQAESFYDCAKKIDLYLNSIPREFVLILTKAEIYKYILEIKLNNVVNLQYFNQDNIQTGKVKISEKAMNYSPFLWWVLTALIKDMEALANSSLDSKKVTKNKDFEARAKILTPWLYEINTSSPQDFNKLLRPHLLAMLLRLEAFLNAWILTTLPPQTNQIAGTNLMIDPPKFSKSTDRDKIQTPPPPAKEVEVIDQAIKELTTKDSKRDQNSQKKAKAESTPTPIPIAKPPIKDFEIIENGAAPTEETPNPYANIPGLPEGYPQLQIPTPTSDDPDTGDSD